MPTIGIQLTEYIGTGSTLVLWLTQAGVVTNTGGDTLTEVSNGYFTATVAESLSGNHDVYVTISGSAIWGDGVLYDGQTVVDRIAAGAALGGDATEAKQDLILSKFTGGQVSIQTPVVSNSKIELIEGDAYDGTRWPLLTWTTEKDYTGFTIRLLIWRWNELSQRQTDMLNAAGVVVSSTSITVSTVANFDAPLIHKGGNPFEKLRFALVATSDSEDQTIVKGDCYVYQRSDE